MLQSAVMNPYLIVIAAYLLLLAVLNILRSRRVRTQDDMMVAGRSLPMRIIVLTLICEWIGSGSIIAGAELTSKAGISALWMSAGAWVGIILIHFLAAKIRTFGRYTVGDILEVRYGPAARSIGAGALVSSYVTIVSYQYKGGAVVLNIITGGSEQGISETTGMGITAAFVIIVTASAGMVAVARSDVLNGIVILVACLVTFPVILAKAGDSVR